MRSGEKSAIFRYVCENCPYELKEENSVDNILDFKNGESIYFLNESDADDPIDQLYEEYLDLGRELDDYISENDLDEYTDYEKIINHFDSWKGKEYIVSGCAALISFADFVLSKTIDLAKE